MPEGNDKLGGMLSISLGILSFCRLAQQSAIVLVRRHDYTVNTLSVGVNRCKTVGRIQFLLTTGSELMHSKSHWLIVPGMCL